MGAGRPWRLQRIATSPEVWMSERRVVMGLPVYNGQKYIAALARQRDVTQAASRTLRLSDEYTF